MISIAMNVKNTRNIVKSDDEKYINSVNTARLTSNLNRKEDSDFGKLSFVKFSQRRFATPIKRAK